MDLRVPSPPLLNRKMSKFVLHALPCICVVTNAYRLWQTFIEAPRRSRASEKRVRDLSYILAPLFKRIISSFFSNPQLLGHQPSLHHSHYILRLLKFVFSLLIAILTTLFLFFSVKLSLSTTLARAAVYLRGQNFSVLVALLLLCSVFLSPAHFWMVYPLILCLSPWEFLAFKVIEWVFNWLYHTLEAIPDLTIVCITQQDEDHHIQVEVDVDVEVQAEAEFDGLVGHTGQEQVNLEEACVVLIAADDET
ncbi:hypothetical protein LguiB_028622 [Lonicera macranthoides]